MDLDSRLLFMYITDSWLYGMEFFINTSWQVDERLIALYSWSFERGHLYNILAEKMQMFTKNFFNQWNFKSTLYQAKLLLKVIETSIENEKKIVVKKKKAVTFLVNGYHILLAPFLLRYSKYCIQYLMMITGMATMPMASSLTELPFRVVKLSF